MFSCNNESGAMNWTLIGGVIATVVFVITVIIGVAFRFTHKKEERESEDRTSNIDW